MPVISDTKYFPPLVFRNGHFNTIYPPFFRKQEKLGFTRRRIETPDEDFLDIDLFLKNNKKAVFLFHGLEGSSESQYIQAASIALSKIGFDIIAINFRGCSGEANNQLISYHSGFTQDMKLVIDTFSDKYDSVSLIGYSLGGNMALKYMGEDPAKVHPKVQKVIAVSAPVHLSDGSKQLQKPMNYFYTKNFLKTLGKKIVEKNRKFPNQIDIEKLPTVRSIWDFDEFFTGPINGFDGAEDYYAQSMSLQFIPDIKTETHLISALDDPFLSTSCYPFAEAQQSKFFHFYPTKYGGHVGFYQKGNKYWLESKLVDILN